MRPVVYAERVAAALAIGAAAACGSGLPEAQEPRREGLRAGGEVRAGADGASVGRATAAERADVAEPDVDGVTAAQVAVVEGKQGTETPATAAVPAPSPAGLSETSGDSAAGPAPQVGGTTAEAAATSRPAAVRASSTAQGRRVLKRKRAPLRAQHRARVVQADGEQGVSELGARGRVRKDDAAQSATEGVSARPGTRVAAVADTDTDTGTDTSSAPVVSARDAELAGAEARRPSDSEAESQESASPAGGREGEGTAQAPASPTAEARAQTVVTDTAAQVEQRTDESRDRASDLRGALTSEQSVGSGDSAEEGAAAAAEPSATALGPEVEQGVAAATDPGAGALQPTAEEQEGWLGLWPWLLGLVAMLVGAFWMIARHNRETDAGEPDAPVEAGEAAHNSTVEAEKSVARSGDAAAPHAGADISGQETRDQPDSLVGVAAPALHSSEARTPETVQPPTAGTVPPELPKRESPTEEATLDEPFDDEDEDEPTMRMKPQLGAAMAARPAAVTAHKSPPPPPEPPQASEPAERDDALAEETARWDRPVSEQTGVRPSPPATREPGQAQDVARTKLGLGEPTDPQSEGRDENEDGPISGAGGLKKT